MSDHSNFAHTVNHAVDNFIDEANEKVVELDEVAEMLSRLISKDKTESRKAMDEVDKYLMEKEKKAAKEDRIVAERTVVNKETKDERRIRLSQEYKNMGNQHFNRGEWKKAKELYTSAILENCHNHLLYTNRAQTEIKLGEYFEAQKDCEQAIKLKPEFVKAYVHLAKALSGLGENRRAVEVLSLGETISNGQTSAISKYKEEILEKL